MHWIDWMMMALPIGLVFGVGLYAHRYMKSVAHFMAGGRLADRYLLAVARSEMFAGAVVFVAFLEVAANSGFTLVWWQSLQVPFTIIIAVSGFVVFRFRETRALTLAQFFEIRYSRKFRLVTGMLAVAAGVLNFGIIPAVGARFFVYFIGLPVDLQLGNLTIPTYIPVMALFLSITLFVTLAGGLITVMVTDCVEGIISQLFYVAIIVSLAFTFTWPQVSHALAARPAHQSLLNPFDSGGLQDFNLWFVIMQIFFGAYGTMAWQNSSAYNSAAANPHESRMSGVLGRWRELARAGMITLLGVCAITFMSHPDFAQHAAGAWRQVGTILDPQVRQQMTMPIALAHLLPIGVKGALCAILVLGVFGGDSTHLHSWGSIFVQDVIAPLRRTPLSPEKHIRELRTAIISVAIFAFIFGALYRQTEYVLMWWKVTTSVFVGGAGAAIVGGLYWKKGTTAGAWTSLVVGALLSGAGIIARQIYGTKFPFNGMEVSFYAMLIAIALYVGVSLLTSRADFDLDRMLHRGAYQVSDRLDVGAVAPNKPKPGLWQRVLDANQSFSRGDKWIAGGLIAWSLLWMAVMLIGTAWNLISPWPESAWSAYWLAVGIVLPVVVIAGTGVWFTWGGVRDIRSLFRRLRASKVDHRDDGRVIKVNSIETADRRVESKT